jgi:hypothetical protein
VRGERRPPRPGEVTHSVMVLVDDATAHCERARAKGARIVVEPTDFESASVSTRPRTRLATSGRSPRRSRMSPPRNGAGLPSPRTSRDSPWRPRRGVLLQPCAYVT